MQGGSSQCSVPLEIHPLSVHRGDTDPADRFERVVVVQRLEGFAQEQELGGTLDRPGAKALRDKAQGHGEDRPQLDIAKGGVLGRPELVVAVPAEPQRDREADRQGVVALWRQSVTGVDAELQVHAAGAPGIRLARDFPSHEQARVQGERPKPLAVV